VTSTFSRAALVGRGVRGGAALVASGAVLSALAEQASAAAVPDSDSAYLRLLIGVELLASDFQSQVIAGGKLTMAQAALVKQMLADEAAHYAGLAQLLTSSGQTPASSNDVEFSYPAGSFDSARSIAKLALEIEALSLGAYLGAVENVQTASLRLPIGQIAGNEAQHVSALSQWVGRSPIGRAFAPALQMRDVSDALDGYES
jgi:hypothetical protein